MTRSRSLAAALTALTLAAPLAHAFSDTSINYRYGPNFTEPGVADANGQSAEIAKNIVGFKHLSSYRYGTNFVNVDILDSIGSSDPANNSSDGAQELYALYRNTVSFKQVSGTERFKTGMLRDVGLTVGFDANTKNTSFAPRKRSMIIGPTLSFDVPGFYNVTAGVYKENNHNGIVGSSVNFDATWAIESSWGVPFNVAGLPLSFEGLLNVTGPKGKDGFGAETKTELLLRPALMLDAGALAGAPANTFRVGLGWEYWYNKFGNDHTKGTGALQSTPYLQVEYHF